MRIDADAIVSAMKFMGGIKLRADNDCFKNGSYFSSMAHKSLDDYNSHANELVQIRSTKVI